ncbi:MAG: hypothetical protein ABIZ80_12905, partial [Bryobacteraceae bacterium]
SAFASVGRISFDGSGNILASNSATAAMNVKVGSYTVSPDCTLTMSLSDAFAKAASTGGTTPGTTTGIPLAITLEGILVSNGNEIDAVQTGNTPGSVVTLRRTTSFNACTNSSLNGTYGFVAQGVETQTSESTGGTLPSLSPFTLIGRLNANGAGSFVADNIIQQSTIRKPLTGTYTVQTDCTGTGKLTDAAGKSRNVNFVIGVDSASGTPNVPSQTPTVQLVFSDSGVTGSGEAKLQ